MDEILRRILVAVTESDRSALLHTSATACQPEQWECPVLVAKTKLLSSFMPNWALSVIEQFNSSLIKLIEKGISHQHFHGDFLKKIKKVKYKANGVSLQHTVSIITQDFLNRKYNKAKRKNMSGSGDPTLPIFFARP